MELVSIVNCTYKPPGTKNWKNAVWFKQKMWYGQVQNAGGGFDSYSRYLDVIAHELTHGITETTAALKYLNESGALNESFSDIFGVVVKNLNGPHPDDPGQWNWEIGSGLKAGGGPLRDLSDPTRTGDPDHMTKYQHKPQWDDGGGVHTNSNIHNKAAYNVLTAKDPNGNFHFEPKKAALLYYLTLTRLSAFATFSDVLATLQNVIRSLWAGQPAIAQEKVDAAVAAYGSAGIT
jgi:bacillolysin/neutral peptidase B